MMGPNDDLERELADLPRPEPARDLAPGVMAALRREAAAGQNRPGLLRPRRAAWAGGGVLAGVLLGALFVWVAMPWEAGIEAPGGCRVRQVEGEVVRLSRGARAPLLPGEYLLVSDGLELGPAARAELDLDPDARLRLHPGTRIQILELEARQRSVQLESGRVSVELLDGGRRTLRVRHASSDSFASGRQGAFEALVREDGGVLYAARRGSLVVQAPGREVVLSAGEQLTLGGQAGPGVPRPLEGILLEELCPAPVCPVCPAPPAEARPTPPGGVRPDRPARPDDGPEGIKQAPPEPDADIKRYQVQW